MKQLSQSLEDLAGQVKALEDSATATFEADRAQLEKRRQEIDEEFTTGAYELGSEIDAAIATGRTRWNETKTSMRKPFDDLRARHDQRRSQHELHRAVRDAEIAEEDAADAIEIATYALDVAEYAVIDAVLARMVADDLAGEPTDTNESVTASGATS